MAGLAGGIKAGRAFILIDAVDVSGKVLDNVKRRFVTVGKELSAIGSGLMTKAAISLLPIGLSTNAYIRFDDAIRMVGIRSQGTKEELDELRQTAIDLGRESAFTATNIANLMSQLGQKGFNRREIQNMTEPVMRLARVGGLGADLDVDAMQAAELVGGVIRAFKKDSSETTHVVDLLAAAINLTNYSMEDLKVSLQYASPAAQHFGLSLETTLASLASLRDLNIDASIIGTAFRNMLTYLSNQEDLQKFNDRLFESTGNVVEFVDAAGNLKPLPQILFAMGKAMEGLGTAQRADMLHDIFGTRAEMPAMALGSAATRFETLMSYFSMVEGMSADMVTTIEQGLGGVKRDTESVLEDIQIAIGEALELALIGLGRQFIGMLQATSEWIRNNKALVSTIVTLLGLSTVLGASILALGVALMFLSTTFTILKTATYPIALLFNVLGSIVNRVLSTTILLSFSLSRVILGTLIPAVSTLIGTIAGGLFSALNSIIAFLPTLVIRLTALGSIVLHGLGIAFMGLSYTIIQATTLMIRTMGYWLVAVLYVGSRILFNLNLITLGVVRNAYLISVGLITMSKTIAIGMIAAFAEVSAALGVLWTSIGLVAVSGVLLLALLTFFSDISKQSEKSTQSVGLLGYTFNKLGDIASSTGSYIESIWNSLSSYLSSAYKLSIESIESMGGSLSTSFSEMGNTLSTTFRGIMSTAEIGNLLGMWTVFCKGLTVFFFQAVDLITNAWNGFIDHFMDGMAGVTVTLLESMKGTVGEELAKELFRTVMSIESGIPIQDIELGEDFDITKAVKESIGQNILERDKQRQEDLEIRYADMERMNKELADLVKALETLANTERDKFTGFDQNFELNPDIGRGLMEDLIRAGGASIPVLRTNEAVDFGTVEAARAAADNAMNLEKLGQQIEKEQLEELRATRSKAEKLDTIDKNIAILAGVGAV